MPLTPSETRALLARLSHRPMRQLGQNFLIDGNIVRKSLELAAVSAGDAIVEIGPGLGTLTRTILETGAHIWAVEYDPRLHAYLAAELVPASAGKLTLTHGDALDHPLANLPPEHAANFKIVANLPYAITTPWLDAVLAGPLPERLVLMVQREAADRVLASHDSKHFGAISIALQSAFRSAGTHNVSRHCFYPVPDIDSCLLHLERRAEPFIFSNEARQLMRACFQQRRKQIAPLLRRHSPATAEAALAFLAQTGASEKSRPEEIPRTTWQTLATLCTAEKPS